MIITKLVHIGGITHNNEVFCTVVAPNRNKMIYELNNYMFDYQYVHNKPISVLKQLPSLDDWTHSKEDNDYWYIDYLEEKLHIWMKTELIDFK